MINPAIDALPVMKDELRINLSKLTWIRKAIDLSEYWNPHNSTINNGWSEQTVVLKDILSFFVNFTELK